MPKSKRNKQIELAKTKKRGLEWKKHLLEEVRTCVDSYANVFVFSVTDMRNSKMKNVREQWKHSRFLIGKNKIMEMALGKSAEDEYRPNLHKIGQEIKGQRGLLFSNKSTEEVLSWFRSYSEGDFARSGNISTEDVKLSAGPLPMFPHSLEPYLRQLGLPTTLVKGEVHLIKDYEVCKSGDALTPESAKILKLLGYEMAEFHITIECMWSSDSTFMKFTDSIDSESKENKKKNKKKSTGKKVTAQVEYLVDDMEIELEKNSDKLENEDLPESKKEANAQLTGASNTPVTITSTPKTQIEDSVSSSAEPENKIDEDIAIIEIQAPDTVKNDTPGAENRRPIQRRTRKSKPLKRDSLPKTPEADISKDSPVFRQLRNRSVKVNRKKK